MKRFHSMLKGKFPSKSRLMAFEVAFFKIHANLFVHGQPTSELLKKIRSGLLDEHIGRVTTLFIEQGISVALTNIAAVFEYGALRSNQMSKSFGSIS